jgi:hypothetical protein
MTLVAPRGAVTRGSWTTLALRPRLELARARAATGGEAAPTRAGADVARAAPAGAMDPIRAPARLAPPRPWSARPVVRTVLSPSASTHERAAGLTLERSRLIVQRLVDARARREEPRGLPVRPATGPSAASAPPALPPPTSSRSAPAGRLPGARPPAMVLPTQPAARDARDGPPDAAPAAREHPQAARPAAAPVVASPVDIASLTDEVVRQLDRRIVAHRERMGRI